VSTGTQAEGGPEVNVVVFARAEDDEDPFVTGVPLHALDGLKQAWDLAREQRTELRAEQITHVVAEWSPTQADQAFVAALMPEAELQYGFQRPTDPAGWPAALAEQRRAFEEEQHRREAENATRMLTNPPPADQQEVLPVLRTFASPFAPTVEIVPDALYLGYTSSAETEDTILSRHLALDALDEYGGPDGVATTFRATLRIAVVEPAAQRRDALYTLRRSPDFRAGAALGLPGFGAALSAWLDTPRLVAGICCNDTLLFAAADGPHDKAVREAVRNHEHRDDLVTPSVFLVEGDRLTLLERQPGED
jgi:hypothetical protein